MQSTKLRSVADFDCSEILNVLTQVGMQRCRVLCSEKNKLRLLKILLLTNLKKDSMTLILQILV